MTLTFTVFSQEIEDFALEIAIDASAKFSELHELILKECGFEECKKQCFLICDDEWRVKNRVFAEDDNTTSMEEDIYLMDSCTIEDVLEEEDGQKLAHVFDPESKRFLLLEVTDTSFGLSNANAHVTRKAGKAPVQFFATDEDEAKPQNENQDIEEDFYGSDGFEEGELDMEGFEIND